MNYSIIILGKILQFVNNDSSSNSTNNFNVY